ncbi:MAG: aminopeptidase P family protein [Marinifilaceae bacterium]
MFDAATYKERRKTLIDNVGNGIILILGNGEASANYPHNTYQFRQDSTFAYYFGIDHPNFAGVLDTESGRDCLFGDDVEIDDIIWMGPQPSVASMATSVGVASSAPFAKLTHYLKDAIDKGRKIHFLPPYRYRNVVLLHELMGIDPSLVKNYASLELIKAVVAQRSVKDAHEIVQLDEAAGIGYEMHTTAMRLCKEGVKEQYIAGVIEGIARSYGKGVSFPVILSQNGQTLHNHDHSQILQKGRLMLTDAGAENNAYYCSDFTRTIPVGGKFSTRQAEVYQAVLDANNKAIELSRPGITYKEVHFEACKVLATGLKNIGLMKGDVEQAVAVGAHALFMPHGLGHMMGLDVHDMEDFGQIYVGYDDKVRPSTQFGAASLRMGRELKPGFVITDEPGCYFIPDLIDKWKAENMHTDFLNYDLIETYKDFGGIRLEDDILITENGCRLLGEKRVPITITEVEDIMA